MLKYSLSFSTNLLGSDYSYVHMYFIRVPVKMLLFLQITHGRLSRKAIVKKDTIFSFML